MATVDGSGQPPVVSMIPMDNLPFLTMVWVGPHTVIGAGHDCIPYTIYTDKNQLRLGSVWFSVDVVLKLVRLSGYLFLD